MGDTWIINMSHYDYKDKEAPGLPKAARKLAEYFASIIKGTVHRASMASLIRVFAAEDVLKKGHAAA